MKNKNIIAALLIGNVILLGAVIDYKNQKSETQKIVEPPIPETVVGWDYQNDTWLIQKEQVMSDSDIERIRDELPDTHYLYTPGNPYKYKSTEEKIEEYVEDNLDELLDN